LKKIIEFSSSIYSLTEIYFKFKYLFSKDNLFFNVFDYFFNYIIINKGTTGSFSDKFLNFGKQINLFLMFIFIRLGEWYYSKESNENKVHEIIPPFRINDIKAIKDSNKIELNKGKCFICKKFPEKESLFLTLCCGNIICNECFINDNDNKKFIEFNNLIKVGNFEYYKCLTCKKIIDGNSVIRLYP